VKTRLRLLVTLIVTVACLVALSGCGSGGAGSTRSAGSSSRTSSLPSTTVPTSVVSVVLHRSGGLKPVAVTRVFTAGSVPPEGFSRADLANVLTAAQALVSADQKVRPLPTTTCCDRYVYRVSIRLSDGTTKTYSSVDGVKQPRAFDDLLSRLV
jgi:hypothetical protein